MFLRFNEIKTGMRVRCIYKDAPAYKAACFGRIGTITAVEDQWSFHIKWDDGIQNNKIDKWFSHKSFELYIPDDMS